jgi:plasmid stabilization system protein ParE
MVGNTYAVLWNTTAVNQLKEIHNYIAQDSSKNAANVVESILQSTCNTDSISVIVQFIIGQT